MFGFFEALAGGALGILKGMVIPLAIGAGVKHIESLPILGKIAGVVTKRIPNSAIPFINLGLSAVIPGLGPVAALSASGLHQMVKIGVRAVAEKVTSGEWSERIAAAIGPGNRLSL